MERKIAGHLITRLEYRYDMSAKDFFYLGGTRATTNQNTITAGMIFVLEPNQ